MTQPKVEIEKKKSINSEKIVTTSLILIIIFTIFVFFFITKSMFFPTETNNQVISQSTTKMPATSRISLTAYDKEIARQMMDKNNDGKCDACGMPVEMCIDSGQLQCNMDSTSTIGVLGSQHIHADFKVYINGNALDFSDKAHMDRMKANLPVSSFIHVDSGAPAPEKTGDILHIHATGVPLWIFFDSIDMKFEKDCFTLDSAERYCNNNDKTLKFYVNRELNKEFGDYVFSDLDKILISYGYKNEDLSNQLNSITLFSQNH